MYFYDAPWHRPLMSYGCHSKFTTCTHAGSEVAVRDDPSPAQFMNSKKNKDRADDRTYSV